MTQGTVTNMLETNGNVKKFQQSNKDIDENQIEILELKKYNNQNFKTQWSFMLFLLTTKWRG